MNYFLFLLSQRIPRWPSASVWWRGLALMLCCSLASASVPFSYQVRIPGPGGSGGTVASFTPSFVSAESNSSTLGNSTGTTVNRCATGAYCAQHVPALAGNTWIFAVQYTAVATTITPTDYICNTSGCSAAGDTCAMIGSATTSQNSKQLIAGYCKNMTAGVTEIKLAFSTNTSGVSTTTVEFSNIDNTTPVDTSVTNTSAGSTTVQAGSFTPASANKFLVMFAVRTQTPVSASCGHSVSDTKCFTAGSGQSGATWVSHSSDAIDGIVEQDTVYTLGSAINPQLTMAGSSGYAAVAISLNTASAGSSRGSGMQVVQVMHQNQNAASSPASVIHVQMRTEGNLIILSAGMGGVSYSITGVTDNDGCTWIHGPKGQVGNTGTGKSDLWYCEGSTPNIAKLIDVAVTGTQADYTIHAYDVIGAKASSALVQEAANVNAGPGVLTTIRTFDFLGSGATDGLAIYNFQENSNTSQSFSSPTGMISNSTLFGGEDISGGSTNPPDENNGWGWLKFTSGNNRLSFVPGFADSSDAGAFAYRVTFFASATATVGTTAAAKAIMSCTHADGNITGLNDGAQEWANESSTNGFKYVSNTCQPFNQTNDQGIIYIGVPFANDQWAQITLGTTSGGTASGGQGIGVTLRASTSAQTEYRIVINTAASNQIQIGKIVAGAFTSLKICSANSTPTSGDTFYWQISGTTITGKQNGSAITSCNSSPATDSAIASGSPGMSFSSSMTSSAITAWSAGNL